MKTNGEIQILVSEGTLNQTQHYKKHGEEPRFR